MIRFVFLLSILVITKKASAWGFYAHKWINRMAVTTLPPALSGFYKSHLADIERWAVLPDQRRYAVPDEACRHYLDFEAYDSIPVYYASAWQLYHADTLLKHGTLPWNIQIVYHRLVSAFSRKDATAIIKCSAELGHYLADAHVPLHTTANYNGQLTNQHGIHGLWESRIPELYCQQYSFYTGPANYIPSVALNSWNLVHNTHSLVELVLAKDKLTRVKIPEASWFEFEQRGNTLIKLYSRRYASCYHRLLDGMVERQMKGAIHTIGSYWYSAWIDAGQPDLHGIKSDYMKEEPEEQKHPEHVHDCKH
jgi:hypothetical protein